jgi:hypothetical protein
VWVGGGELYRNVIDDSVGRSITLAVRRSTVVTGTMPFTMAWILSMA